MVIVLLLDKNVAMWHSDWILCVDII